MEANPQITHECETTWVKSPRNKEWRLGFWYGEAWQTDYIGPPSHQGKCHILTMVNTITWCLETYPVNQALSQDTILSLEIKICGDVVPQK